MTDVLYKAYGAVRQLYKVEEWPRGMYQILLEGPAGTGKTRGLLEWVDHLCEDYPGIRVLFLRRTKESLAESVLDTWENHVLYPGHPCIVGSAGTHTRQFYTYPNGSHIVLGGLKDKSQAEKTFSTQYDVIIVFEAREIPDLNMWQWLARANRNWKLPWQLRIADTNPGAEFHWLNQYFPTAAEGGAFHRLPPWATRQPPFMSVCDQRHRRVIARPGDLHVDEDGKIVLDCPECGERAQGAGMFRLLSRFRDNPVWWDHRAGTWTPEGLDYVEGNLALLTGAPRANLYEGRWASEEGVIYEEWDPAVHVVDEAPEKVDWYFAAFDPGYRHPACLQVWAVVEDAMWRVREIYRTEQDTDWWAERVLEINKEMPLQALVCDSEEPEMIDVFNDRLGETRGRDGERIARKASKSIKTGIDMVRWALSKRDGGPRLRVVRGSLEGKDPARIAKMKPACLEEEIGSYIWLKAEDGKPHKEKPDPTCADHAMDAMRYAAMFLWRRDLTPPEEIPDFEPWSMGDVLRHKDVLQQSARSA